MFHSKWIMKCKVMCSDPAYALFRVVFGYLFFLHGLQKFGVLNGGFAIPTQGSLIVAAAFIETIAGLLILLGLATEFAAFVASGQMAVAYWMFHALGPYGKGAPWYNPITNSGEAAVLFSLAFLFIAFTGGGKYSLDARLCKKCRK